MMPQGTKSSEPAFLSGCTVCAQEKSMGVAKPLSEKLGDKLSDESRYVTALFRDLDTAERAYRAAEALGYETADINLVVADATRDRLLAERGGAHSHLSNNAAESAENPTKGPDLGGPTGGALGTIAPVIAAVGTVALIPGLVFAGPIAVALTAAGAVGLAGGLIGALKDWGIPQERVRDYEGAVRDGAILLGVKARSAADASQLERQWRAEGGRFVKR
jgi:hypothetical protein